jgi:hypothetical protein
MPGWCDRILYNSLPDMVGTLEPEVSPGGRVDLEGAPCDNYFAITGQLMASDHSAIACGFNLKVWEVPSWPRSWPNFSLSQLHSHRNAWANLHILANLTRFSLKVREVPDLPVSVYKLRIFDAKVGLGRIVALYCRPSALYQIH